MNKTITFGTPEAAAVVAANKHADTHGVDPVQLLTMLDALPKNPSDARCPTMRGVAYDLGVWARAMQDEKDAIDHVVERLPAVLLLAYERVLMIEAGRHE